MGGSGVPLAEAAMWRAQTTFYAREGQAAWADDLVRHVGVGVDGVVAGAGAGGRGRGCGCGCGRVCGCGIVRGCGVLVMGGGGGHWAVRLFDSRLWCTMCLLPPLRPTHTPFQQIPFVITNTHRYASVVAGLVQAFAAAACVSAGNTCYIIELGAGCCKFGAFSPFAMCVCV